jgi:hypothetical protein
MNNQGFITLNDLITKFRAAGTYTVYRDNTATPQVQSNQPIRLIYGVSKTGIPNIPVLIPQNDIEAAERLYGKRDLSLERKGSWFHKSLEVALNNGPVLALNLLKTNNEVDENGVPTEDADVVNYRSFSTDVATQNGIVRDKLYASFYNKERFWKPDAEYLLGTRHISDQGSILNFTNLSQVPCTVLIKKSTVKGYDITAKDWFGIDEVPPFVKPSDYISDYFIEVIVLNGNYGSDKYEQLSTDPQFGEYFDINGLIASKLEDFIAKSGVTVRLRYSGCLIPDFRDKNGIGRDIEYIINQQANYTGILCAIDKTQLDLYESQTTKPIKGR